jgi:hypothetical protein
MRSQFDDIDRLMTEDDTIVPSSGFAGAVMDAVQAAVEDPPPLRFPWGRFALGVAACLLWAAAGLSVLRGVDVLLPPVIGAPAGESWQLLQPAAVIIIATFALLRFGPTPFRRSSGR